MFMDILAACLVLFLTFVYINNKKDPKPIFGVYYLPGKWYIIKYPLFLTLMVLRKVRYYLVGKEGLYDEKQLEKCQPLSTHPLGFDAVFFHGASQEGVFLCAGGERRQDGVMNGLVYLKHPKYGLLKSMKLPKTRLQATSDCVSGKNWSAEGLCMVPVEPMKTWDISFRGEMKAHDTDRVVHVELQTKFTSTMPWIMFEVDLPIKMLARSIAREPWTRDKFKKMKDAHQSHYEQMGDLQGLLKVDGEETPLNMDGFRDHSFGFKRDWTLMHRYIFHMFYLSNQTRITLGVICQPCTASRLEMGYVNHANGKVDIIESCDLFLYQHGESGKPSDDLWFTFNAGGVTYECKVVYDLTVAHFVGHDNDVKMYERFLSCEVNGIKGKGISEWNYSNTNGKFNLNQYHC